MERPRRPSTEPTTSPVDARIRVVAASLEPALRLAHRMALPLSELQELVATGYFREARGRGLSMRAIAARFGRSLRTIAALSRRSALEADPLAGSRTLGWRRRAVAYLAAHGSADIDEIGACIPEADQAAIARELAYLEAEGIIAAQDGRWQVVARQITSLRHPDFDQRLDSLRQFLQAVTQATYRRFFPGGALATAMARVLTFRVQRAELPSLAEAVYEHLRQAVVAADEAADRGSRGAVTASAAFCMVELPEETSW